MRNINRKCSIFDFLLKKNFFFQYVPQDMINELNGVEVLNEEQEWQQQNNKNYYNWKKKFLDFRIFFKKIQLFMSVERKTILDVVAIKHRKQFLKIDLKNLNFRAKRNSKNILPFLTRKFKYFEMLIFTFLARKNISKILFYSFAAKI